MVALETTKRKFHKLLEGITNNTNSTRPASDLSGEADGRRPVKRVRLEPITLTERLPKGPPSTIRQTNSVRSHFPIPKEAPNYVPWSHDYFLARLKTFSDIHSWTPKPTRINEVAWAKQGWTCDGMNKVACKGGCEARVVVLLRPQKKNENGEDVKDSEDYSQEIAEELVNRYVALLTLGHDESCLWRTAGCKDDIYRMPIARPAIWQPQLKERYNSFIRMADRLPLEERIAHPFNMETTTQLLESTFLTQDSSSTTPESTSKPTEIPSCLAPINKTAMAFALLGWTGSLSSDSSPLATCNVCYRRLGLWLYGPPSDTSTPRFVRAALSTLDLVANHRQYCPWIDPVSQSMPGSFAGLAGWQILERNIQNHAGLSRSSLSSTVVQQQLVDVMDDDTEVRNSIARGDGEEPVAISMAVSPLSSKKSAKDIELEDKIRFARLKELTKLMDWKRFRGSISSNKRKDASAS